MSRAALALVVDGLVAALLGGLATLGFAPRGFYPVTLAAVVGLFVLWRGVGPARGAWRGFVFGCALFGGAIEWMNPAPGVDSGGAALVAMVAYLACYPALAGAIAAAARPIARPFWALLIVPAAWGITELLRAWIGIGFSGLSLGFPAGHAPVANLAPLVGVRGLGMALVAAAGTLWLLYTGALAARLMALALIAVLPLIVWWMPPAAFWTHPAGRALRILVIQAPTGRTGERPPLAPAGPPARYAQMAGPGRPNIVAWPGLSISIPARRVRSALARIDADAARRGQTVLALVRRPIAQQTGGTDGLLVLGTGRERDDAHRLGILGESAPGPFWLADKTPGKRLVYSHGAALDVTAGCEDRPGDDHPRDRLRAGILIELDRDSGSTTGTAKLARRLDAARLRALETGRPLVRATNTGISAIIDFDGRIYRQAPAGKTTRLIGDVTPRRGLTPYIKYGDKPLWWATLAIVCLGLLAGAALRGRAANTRRLAERRRMLRDRV